MNTSRDDYDVTVVGARAAGASTAMLLARAGLRVLVLERDRPGADTLSTHALMRGGVVQLARWGLLDRVTAAGTPAVRRTAFHYESDSAVVTIKPAAGVDALYAPRRTVLDPILVDAAREAGAEVRHGVSVTGLHRDGAGRVRGITARDRGGRPFSVRSRLTIGADGVRSTVAREVGAPVLQRGRRGGAYLSVYVEGLATEGYEWFYRPGATAGMIPTNDGLTCVFAGMPLERFRPGGAGERWQSLVRAFTEAGPDAADRLAAATPVEPVRGYPGLRGVRRKAWGPGWALVGDAGYYKDPISTHGITQALRDAELLTGAVSSFDRLPERQALAGYQHRRDRLSAGLFATTDRIAAYEWDDDAVRGLLRALAAGMASEVELLASLDNATPLRRARSA